MYLFFFAVFNVCRWQPFLHITNVICNYGILHIKTYEMDFQHILKSCNPQLYFHQLELISLGFLLPFNFLYLEIFFLSALFFLCFGTSTSQYPEIQLFSFRLRQTDPFLHFSVISSIVDYAIILKEKKMFVGCKFSVLVGKCIRMTTTYSLGCIFVHQQTSWFCLFFLFHSTNSDSIESKIPPEKTLEAGL